MTTKIVSYPLVVLLISTSAGKMLGMCCLKPITWLASKVKEDVQLGAYSAAYLAAAATKSSQRKQEACKKISKILGTVRLYKDEKIIIQKEELLTTDANVIDRIAKRAVNCRPIELPDSLIIYSAKILPYDQMLSIIDTDFHLHLFCLHTGKKINRTPIALKKNRTITLMGVLDKNILYIQYYGNMIYLFDLHTGTKISKKTVRAQKNKKISWVKILNNMILCIQYYGSTIDLFSIKTSKKINTEPISAALHKKIIDIHILRDHRLCVKYMRQTDLFNIISGKKIGQEQSGPQEI